MRNSYVYVMGRSFTKTEMRRLVKEMSAFMGRRASRTEAVKMSYGWS